jgi:hypothetical protein
LRFFALSFSNWVGCWVENRCAAKAAAGPEAGRECGLADQRGLIGGSSRASSSERIGGRPAAGLGVSLRAWLIDCMWRILISVDSSSATVMLQILSGAPDRRV